jgi:hypothetical protein
MHVLQQIEGGMGMALPCAAPKDEPNQDEVSKHHNVIRFHHHPPHIATTCTTPAAAIVADTSEKIAAAGLIESSAPARQKQFP